MTWGWFMKLGLPWLATLYIHDFWWNEPISHPFLPASCWIRCPTASSVLPTSKEAALGCPTGGVLDQLHSWSQVAGGIGGPWRSPVWCCLSLNLQKAQGRFRFQMLLALHPDHKNRSWPTLTWCPNSMRNTWFLSIPWLNRHPRFILHGFHGNRWLETRLCNSCVNVQ